MKKSILFTVCALVFGWGSLQAQDPEFEVKGEIQGLANDTIFLANYLGDKLYYNDTCAVDAKGRFEFDKKKYSEGGKYAVVLPGPKVIELILGEDDVFLTTDLNDHIGSLTFKKSKNNQIFLDYVQFINERMKLRRPFDAIINDSTSTEVQKEMAIQQIQQLNKEVREKQKEVAEEHGDLLVGKYTNMLIDFELPEVLPEDYMPEADSLKRKIAYYREHFWDNVDLTDNRIVRDQSFQKVLSRYMEKVMPQNPDSVIRIAFRMIEEARGKYDLFKYLTHKFTFYSESSKIMCMDRVFVAIVDRYYKAGDVDWLSDEKLQEIIQGADDKRASLCGEIAPNVILPDTTGQNWKSMYDLGTPYTLLVVWESTCGHCKKEMPKLKKVAEDWEGTLGIYAINNEMDNAKWKEFVLEKGLHGWTHVSRTPEIMVQDSATRLILKGITTIESLNYPQTFNVKSTPQLFLLDENFEIIAKQLNSEQVDGHLRFLTGKTEEEPSMEKAEDLE